MSAVGCDVWWGRLSDVRPWHAGLLDQAERARSAAFRRAEDRDRFLLGAVLLRLTLGRRLAVDPAQLHVDRTCDGCGRQHGRPRVAGDRPFVSVAHSGRRVVVAVTEAGPVGVDVEEVVDQDFAPLLDIATSPEERPNVRTVDEFFRCWTCKESVLKATGDGLRTPPRDVRLSSTGRSGRASVRGRVDVDACWQLLTAGPGYAGALAVLGDAVAVREIDAGPLLRGGPNSGA